MMIPQGNETVVVNDLKDPRYREQAGRLYADKGHKPPEYKVLGYALGGLLFALLCVWAWVYFMFIA